MAKFEVRRWTEHRPPTPAILIGCLGVEGYFIKHWVGRPGMSYAWRKITVDQTHWVVSGELEIIHEQGGAYTLRAGDRDFIPAGTWYMRRVVGDEPSSFMVGEKREAEKPKRKRGRPKKKL